MAVDLGTFGTVATIILAALALGGLVNHAVSKYVKEKQEQRAVAEAAAQDAKQVRQALTGKPADEFGPADPGLLKNNAQLTEQGKRLVEQVSRLTDTVTGLTDKVHKLQIDFQDHCSATNGRHP